MQGTCLYNPAGRPSALRSTSSPAWKQNHRSFDVRCDAGHAGNRRCAEGKGTEHPAEIANAFMADCDCNLRILGLARQQIMGLV
jgi:hypothetical protein